jgi:hypothetical protein
MDPTQNNDYDLIDTNDNDRNDQEKCQICTNIIYDRFYYDLKFYFELRRNKRNNINNINVLRRIHETSFLKKSRSSKELLNDLSD